MRVSTLYALVLCGVVSLCLNVHATASDNTEARSVEEYAFDNENVVSLLIDSVAANDGHKFLYLFREENDTLRNTLQLCYKNIADEQVDLISGVYTSSFVMQQLFRREASADTLTLIPDFMGLQRPMTLISTPEPNLFKNSIKR